MKSTGFGFSTKKSTTTSRLTILLLLTTLAFVSLILLGMALFISGKTQRFKAAPAEFRFNKIIGYHRPLFSADFNSDTLARATGIFISPSIKLT